MFLFHRSVTQATLQKEKNEFIWGVRFLQLKYLYPPWRVTLEMAIRKHKLNIYSMYNCFWNEFYGEICNSFIILNVTIWPSVDLNQYGKYLINPRNENPLKHNISYTKMKVSLTPDTRDVFRPPKGQFEEEVKPDYE